MYRFMFKMLVIFSSNIVKSKKMVGTYATLRRLNIIVYYEL